MRLAIVGGGPGGLITAGRTPVAFDMDGRLDPVRLQYFNTGVMPDMSTIPIQWAADFAEL